MIAEPESRTGERPGDRPHPGMTGAPTEPALRFKGEGLYLVLIAANVAAWGWAWLAFAGNPVLLASAFLAYVFGLRHAVDADHIAAIDNATRKLIEAGRPARTTGLFFSLGHSTVVILASFGIALLSARLQTSLAEWRPLAGALSTAVSVACLFLLAVANGVILVSVCRLLAGLKRGDGRFAAASPGAQTGLLGWMLRGLFRFVGKAWHLYPIGFLFGLGFDTATEIGVLGLSAAQASQALPLMTVMVFPALFTAGMTLVDTLDALAMAAAYRWAAFEARRKLWYNLTITLVSVAAAVAIGVIELLGLFAPAADGSGEFWAAVASFNDGLAVPGAALIALLAAVWLVAVLISRLQPASSRG